MKKVIFLSLFLLCAFTFSKAQTAFDFTATDCASASHTLFTELDAGITIIMVWVMPCGACVSASTSASAKIAALANPNVVFYLFDDAGGSCTSLSSWATSNGITPTAIFDNAGNVNAQSNYGSGGMPKTVVVGGGASHMVYLAQNGSVTAAELQTAIDNSLSAIAAVPEFNVVSADVNLFPNPATAATELTYTLTKPSDVTIKVYNTLGQKIISTPSKNQIAGKQTFEINSALFEEGIYFVLLTANAETITAKFSVVN